MKQIIDGFLYDTDTAEQVYIETQRNIRYYMTPKRKFFIVYSTGEFKVVEENFIKDLLGKYDIEKYIEVFGEPQEG